MNNQQYNPFDPNNPLAQYNLNNNYPAISGSSLSQFGNSNTISQPIPLGGVTAPTGIMSKLGNFGSIASGIASLGGLYTSLQANKLAKQQLGFQRGAFNSNLANNQQSYNTALEDRINSRYYTEGRTQQEANSYIAANKLKQGSI